MAKARYIMIGGFLGAGKTTAILQLAQKLLHHLLDRTDGQRAARRAQRLVLLATGRGPAPLAAS